MWLKVVESCRVRLEASFSQILYVSISVDLYTSTSVHASAADHVQVLVDGDSVSGVARGCYVVSCQVCIYSINIYSIYTNVHMYLGVHCSHVQYLCCAANVRISSLSFRWQPNTTSEHSLPELSFHDAQWDI